MATDAILVLERLCCNREDDGSGHSEPYIWPVLLWIDDNTLATPELVGMTSPVLGNARVVIKEDMRAGQVAAIPPSVGMLRVRLEDNLSVRRLILTVALWEEDETPEDAMRAGYKAFSNELRAAIADNLFALNQASGDELDALIEAIKARVKGKVTSAIRDGLTGWQKTRVFLGTLNLDDIVNSAFVNFGDPVATQFTLQFLNGANNNYEIDGSLQMRPVVVDRCQAQVDAVKAAQAAVNGVDAQIRALQEELKHASPAEKSFIIAEIKRLRAEELVEANQALEEARKALEACRARLVSTRPDVVDVVLETKD